MQVWCPAEHPARKTGTVSHFHRATALGARNSLRRALEAASPDFVIPCDDEAARLMHELHTALSAVGPEASLRRLIAHSLGEPGSCQRASARAELIHIAEMAGVRVAPTRVIASLSSIREWAEDIGFPAVLKINGSWGGMGVVTVQNVDQARAAYHRAAHPSWRDAVRALLLRRHTAAILRLMHGKPPIVTMQKFVHGRVASRSVACWRGEVLAGLNTLHLKSEGPTGPATVIEITDCAEMEHATERLLDALGMSGFCGLDFVIEAGTGTAHLLEMNPRATATCHLPLDGGRDLPRALLARICPSPLPTIGAPLSAGIIALFPGEWRRDSRSAYLRTALHDVPWRETALIRDAMDTPWAERGLVARVRAWFGQRRRRFALAPAPPRPSATRAFGLDAFQNPAPLGGVPGVMPNGNELPPTQRAADRFSGRTEGWISPD